MPDLNPASPAGAAPEAKAPKPGLFAPKAPAAAPGVSAADLAEEVNNVNTRLKVIEERYNNLRKKFQVIEQNMIIEDKKIKEEIKLGNADILEVQKNVEDMKDKLRLMVKELKLCAKLEDVEVLKKYIELWEPLNFVTKAELDKVIDEKVEESLSKLSSKN